MPKIVDHDHKRKMIAETAWKIIETEGIEKASIRRIASEVGMSTRALRHYFSNKMNYYYLVLNIFLLLGKNGRRINHGQKNPLFAVQKALLEMLTIF